MTSALVPLLYVDDSATPLWVKYRLGSALFHGQLLVCLTCETVVGSVKESPVCPVCTLREEIERALDDKDEWDWGDEYGKF